MEAAERTAAGWSVEVERAVSQAHREQWTSVLASTVRIAGDLDLAEDCVQDAYLSALRAWADTGIPNNPAGWLITTARRKALDTHRRTQILTGKLPLLIEPGGSDPGLFDPIDSLGAGDLVDDQLRLIFTCCHPALDRQAQTALTLRTVCGMATADVARSFLVSDTTMAARLTRAKKKIATARIPYRVPDAAELPDRLDAVLTVLHLLFSAAHEAHLTDPGLADDLAARSLRLARVLVELMPDETEARGLLALLLLSHARRDARVADGELVLLADQDRSRWDARLISEGLALLPSALRGPGPGRFALQAAIAALHCEARHASDTDWVQILQLYDELLGVWPSHVVALNRAAAAAEVHGPSVALRMVEELAGEPRMRGYRYLHSTRAELLRRLDRAPEAVDAYTDAIGLSDPGPERDFLVRKRVEAEGLSLRNS